MDTLRELLRPADLIYLVPVAMGGVFLILRRVGVEIDFFGVLDALDGANAPKRRRSRLQAYLRGIFPSQGLITLTVALFILGWTSTGLGLNHGFRGRMSLGLHLLTFGVACVVGFWTAFLGTRAFHFLLPSEQRTTSIRDLVGHTATVTSDWEGASYGRARVTDDSGNTITVFCRRLEGSEPLHAGSSVTLVNYDPDERIFDVMPQKEDQSRKKTPEAVGQCPMKKPDGGCSDDRPTRERVYGGILRYAETGQGDVRKVKTTGLPALRIGDWRVYFEDKGESLQIRRVEHRIRAYRQLREVGTEGLI